MRMFNIHDAKTQFSKMISRVQTGESVVIAKNGSPVAKLVPFERRPGSKRPFGTAKGFSDFPPAGTPPSRGRLSTPLSREGPPRYLRLSLGHPG